MLRRLNAPFGAQCFLTRGDVSQYASVVYRLYAPFGARRFLTNLIPAALIGALGGS